LLCVSKENKKTRGVNGLHCYRLKFSDFVTYLGECQWHHPGFVAIQLNRLNKLIIQQTAQ